MAELSKEIKRMLKQRDDVRTAVLRMLEVLLAQLISLFMKYSAFIGTLVLVVFFAVILAIGWLRPVYNWDMMAYYASGLRDSLEGAGALHAATYSTFQSLLPADAFAALSAGDAWRAYQFANPEAFVSMLGMYEVKWLYVELFRVLGLVVDPFQAGYFINFAALILFGTSLIWWLHGRAMLAYAPLVVLFLMIAGFPNMAMVASPDMLTTALVVTAFVLLDRYRIVAGIVLLVLAVLVRPDQVASAGVLMALAFLFRSRSTVQFACGFAAAIAVYLFVTKTSQHPGFWPHFWFSTYQMQDTLIGFSPDFSLRVYAIGFAWNIVRSFFETTWLAIYLAMCGALAISYARGMIIPRHALMLICVLMVSIAAKFVIFPLPDGRTHLPLLIPAMLLMFAHVGRNRAAVQHAPEVE